MPPTQALIYDIEDLVKIYKREGKWNEDIKMKLLKYAHSVKRDNPKIFTGNLIIDWSTQ